MKKVTDEEKRKEEAVIIEMETTNAKFLQLIRDQLEPFYKKLLVLHKNTVDFNSEERTLLKNSIDAIKFYATKEAEESGRLRDKSEKDIVNEVNHELAIVKALIRAINRGKFDEVEKDCELLQAILLRTNEDLEEKERRFKLAG